MKINLLELPGTSICERHPLTGRDHFLVRVYFRPDLVTGMRGAKDRTGQTATPNKIHEHKRKHKNFFSFLHWGYQNTSPGAGDIDGSTTAFFSQSVSSEETFFLFFILAK